MHITLSGYYGFDNTGDEALLSAITSSVYKLEEGAEFTVLSGAPDKTFEMHGVPSVYYLNPFRVIKTIKNTDLLISGGGSIFQDITSGRSLSYYISVVALARFYDKPVIFYAQGVGPINRRISKFLMRLVGNHATMITLRDQESMDYLHSIGVSQPPMQVTADPVFSLAPTQDDSEKMRAFFQNINPEEKPTIGVSLREWARLDGYQSALAALLDCFYEKGYCIIFVSMAYPDDISAGEKVAELMTHPAVLIHEHHTSQEHLALISEFDLLIGMRLHSLIFAANRGVPLAGISYDPKVDSFLKILGQEPMPLDFPEMQEHITRTLEESGNFKEQAESLHRQAGENARLALSLLEKPPEDETETPLETNAVMSPENNRTTGRNFIGVSSAMLIAKGLGFFRDVVFASTMGTTIVADAFQTIFGLPMLLFTGVGNSLSTVNMPELTNFLRENKTDERKAYITNISMQIMFFFGIISLLGIVLAPFLASLLVPGLEDEARYFAVTLTMIMIPTLLLVNFAYFSAGVLQAHGFFTLSSMISIPFNLLIIIAILLRGDDIIFVGYMTTAGWFLQFAVQYPRLRSIGYRLLGRISFKSTGIWRNIIPIWLGYSALQVCLIIDRRFGTFLPEGTTSALAYGSNLSLTITSVFVMAISIIVFPRLSKFCAEKDFAKIRELIGTVFQILLFVLLPYMLLIVVYHKEIVMIIYERGTFDRESTIMTSTAFLFYSFVAFGYACQEVFNRVFYAFKKFKLPMIVSLCSILLNVVANLVLYRYGGIVGISLSTAVIMLLYAAVLFWFMRCEIGGGLGLSLIFALLRSVLPLSAMLPIILIGRNLGESPIIVIATILISGVAYLAVAFSMGFVNIFKR